MEKLFRFVIKKKDKIYFLGKWRCMKDYTIQDLLFEYHMNEDYRNTYDCLWYYEYKDVIE